MRNCSQQQGWCQWLLCPRKLRHQEELQLQREHLHLHLDPRPGRGKVNREIMKICWAQSEWWGIWSGLGKNKPLKTSYIYIWRKHSLDVMLKSPHNFTSAPLYEDPWIHVELLRKRKSHTSHLLTYMLRWGTADATGCCFWISCRKNGCNEVYIYIYWKQTLVRKSWYMCWTDHDKTKAFIVWVLNQL